MKIACCVRDDAAFVHVQSALLRAGIGCERCSSEVSLMRMLRHGAFDLIIIDLESKNPKQDSFFSWLNCRTAGSTPVIFLSPVQSGELASLALDAGADDFIAKPFDPSELVSRVRAILRRSGRPGKQSRIEHMGFVIDQVDETFHDNGKLVELTPREFTMAWLFFSTPGVYISRETISVAIWGVDSDIAGRSIEQHVYKLRKKLQLGKERGVTIRTAYTQGYRLELSQPEKASDS